MISTEVTSDELEILKFNSHVFLFDISHTVQYRLHACQGRPAS